VVHPPSVDAVARSLRDTGLPDPLLVDVARVAVAEAGRHAAPDAVRQRARQLAEQRRRRLLLPVINATGVLLHTNLGRAPYGHDHAAAYRNVEFDLARGERGNRNEHAATLLARACGAEAALVVNNCAAAMVLTLAALAGPGRAAVASRGELVEIGGGFRVPEVLAASGTELLEVGTTNRTRAGDYRRALAQHADRAALLLKVHQSNYRIVGFTEAVAVDELAAVARDAPARRGGDVVPLVVDIGSGLLDAACPWLPGGPPPWLKDEPAAHQTLAQGADLVVFSGDKLLGGPQAGVIAGRADLVTRIAAHPLARAMRCGALVLAALQQLALDYLDRRADAIPFWRMATIPVGTLQARAEALGVGTAGPTDAVPGGGTLPGVTIPSYGVRLDGDQRGALRAADPPVIARVERDRTVLDLRTVEPEHDHTLAAALTRLARPR
jgi:L-seryl-tRNA(Ser) seleniumtransferase